MTEMKSAQMFKAMEKIVKGFWYICMQSKLWKRWTYHYGNDFIFVKTVLLKVVLKSVKLKGNEILFVVLSRIVYKKLSHKLMKAKEAIENSKSSWKLKKLWNLIEKALICTKP